MALLLLPRGVKRIRRVFEPWGNQTAMTNARTSLEHKELALARANLAMAHGREFCGISLLLLGTSLENGDLCPWSFNRVIDLMYAKLPSEEARALILDLLDHPDVITREKMLRRAIEHQDVEEGKLHLDEFTAPSYLHHPSIRR